MNATRWRFVDMFCAAVALSLACAPAVLLAAEPAPVDQQVAALFKQHCLRCHGEKKAEGDLRLDQLAANFDSPATFDRWHTVVKRLRAGDMPPEDEPRPDAAQVAAVVRRITAQLDAAAAQHRAAGRTVLRRLNRVEYENTVRDLFAVDVSVRETLPEDTVSHGFDNVGEALNVSPVLIERYLEAADAVISAAIAPIPTIESKTQRLELVDSIPSWFMPGVLKRDHDVVLFRSDGSATGLNNFSAPVTGKYRFRVSASAYQADGPLPMAVLVGNFRVASGQARYIGYFDVYPGEPQIITIEARLQPRETIKVQPVYLPRVYIKQDNIREYPGSGLAVGSIEVEGPLAETWPTESYRRVFGDVDPKTGTLADAEQLLKKLLPRAFRRPTTEAELAPYVALVAQGLERGEPFDVALRGGIKGILCSPKFLFLKETPGALDDYALASRLSYFLWSSLPDDALLDLAARGELQKPAVLRVQVERMLADPRGQEFVENFCGQWLSLRDINFTTPDKQLYPEFEELLGWSMVQETQSFFDELLRNDLSVLNFIDSDFAMLNERLARHYGIEGVRGVALRKVPIRPEHHRGGVLTHASVLKVTANGTTTSPVVRGVWVMDRIIGRPIPPPPANVPAIEPDIRGATTIREQLARHREIASCASCHAQIDPPGFALENYDVIGGWRDRYRALGTKERFRLPDSPIYKYQAKPEYGLGLPVDAGDTLADGRHFADLDEFKKLLLAEPDQVARCVTEKLVVYATGQPVEYGDREVVDRIVAESRPSKYGLRSLVHLVVQSELFRSK